MSLTKTGIPAARNIVEIQPMHEVRKKMPRIDAGQTASPPRWALMQRHLMTLMDKAAEEFTERYTYTDGTIPWTPYWPGMDGSDDAYETFSSFPLQYALGGGKHLLEHAHKEWNAITWQWTQYGTVHREFDCYYDWMHHGESYAYIYFLGIADPTQLQTRQRALNFSAMYMGEDEEAPNYDPEKKLIRSPLTGSRGPRFHVTAEDWYTHRWVLTVCVPGPYEDIPGFEYDDPMTFVSWEDDKCFAAILDLFNKRMSKGDVPLNLVSTTLMAHAFLYTGDKKYSQWILDYFNAWKDRTKRNNGIIPDNVDLNDVVGGNMDGKWWGGYYGYRWPHGTPIVHESVLIAGSNALMMTGDKSQLDLLRSQLDYTWSLGKEVDGVFKTPHRHGDKGWYDWREPNPMLYFMLWNITQEEQDLARLRKFASWPKWKDNYGSHSHTTGAMNPWFAYMQGENPDYPEKALEAVYRELNRRMKDIRTDEMPREDAYIQHWIGKNPVVAGTLAQMMWGGDSMYHGSLFHGRVRYFDPMEQRPGLPADVGALVEKIAPEEITLCLANTNLLEERDVIVQAGVYGEHEFEWVAPLNDKGEEGDRQPVGGKYFWAHLGSGVVARYRIGMKRYVNTPTYDLPWCVVSEVEPVKLQGRGVKLEVQQP